MNQITKHTIPREIKDNISLSLPLMTAWIIYSLSPFAGTVMIAHLGKDVLAASVLVATIWIAGITFCFGLYHSVSVLVSQQLGAKNYEAISETMGQGFTITLLSWIPILILMWFIPYLVHWSAPNQAILQYATQYAHAISWSIPGLTFLAMLEHFLNGIEKTKLSLWISILEVPLEILLIYIFVFGKLGLPAFGIAGVGYGLAVSYTLTTICVLLFLYYAPFAQPFKIFKHFGTFDWRYIQEMLRIGMPIALTYFIELVAFTIATYFISRFSATVLAAHQIVLQFEGVIINIAYALSQSVAIRVGLNVGRDDKIGVRYSSYVGLGIAVVAALIILFVLTYFSRSLLSIDLNMNDPQNAELIKQAISLFFILGFYQLFDTIRVIQAGALRGLKDTRYPMMINIICFFGIGLLSAYMIGIYYEHGGQGVWLGLTFGMFLGAIALSIRLKKLVRQADLAKILHF